MMVIVVLGPMGCGKTTIGEMLAEYLSWDFYDADDFHPEPNKKKMGNGIPLDDDDREPWLVILHQIIQEHVSGEKGMVLACSALKEKYRSMLGIDQQQVCSVFLKGSYELLNQRISSRSHEYMDKGLLQSQLDTLEEPQNGLTVDISTTPTEICRTITDSLLGSDFKV